MEAIDTAKPMTTPTGQIRREEVFRTAAELMVERGYAGTSMGDLAKAVGMTKAGLYHHISSKQDMLFQILLHAMERLERVVVEPAKSITDPEKRLREMIRRHVCGLFDQGLEFTLLFPERRHLEPAQQQVVVQRIENYLGMIRHGLQDLADEGRLQDLDINIAARHILQTIAGIARWYREDSGATKDHLVEQTVNFNLSAILKR